MKASRPDAVPVAGGTDLLVDLNFSRLRPELILDLSRVPELTTMNGGEVVEMGSMVTFARIARDGRWPAFVEAARTVGSPQIRNRATIGGNIGTASPAGDGLPVLYAYDAEVVVGRHGVAPRRVSAEAFFVGPRSNALEEDELILGVRWKSVSGPSVFAKIGTRNAMVISVANLCLAIDPAARRVGIALGSVGPTVLRARAADELLQQILDDVGYWNDTSAVPDEAGLAEVAEAVAREARPIDDIRGTARYRRHACRVLAKRALRWALPRSSDRVRAG